MVVVVVAIWGGCGGDTGGCCGGHDSGGSRGGDGYCNMCCLWKFELKFVVPH